MSNKRRLDDIVSETGKRAQDLLDKSKNFTVSLLDQNEDGKLDGSDISAIKEKLDEKAWEYELKKFRPVFAKNLEEDYFMSKFIRVTERDKKHAESEACRGSIGSFSDKKGIRVIIIFLDSLDSFNLDFYPDSSYEFYYVDPSDQNRYIALDEYFSCLKIARINELQRIAQDLGARHFKVTYKEEQASFIDKKANVRSGAKKSGARVDCESTSKKFSTVEIEADMEFPPHEPVRPQLKYMQNDPSIQTLIEMRMNETAPILSQKFMLNLSNTSGIKESDAIKIDAVLKGLNLSGNITVASEVRNESRRYLEYEIEF